MQCALEDDEETTALLAGVDQLVHVEPALPLPASGGDNTWLDLATRCSYNLLRAAAAAGVARATVLGSMDVFMPYSVDHGVLPEWQPLPSAELSTLAPHMGEFVAREFAMCAAVRVLVARLGTLVAAAPAADASDAPRWWITAEEAAEAIVTELIVRFPSRPFAPPPPPRKPVNWSEAGAMRSRLCRRTTARAAMASTSSAATPSSAGT